MADGAVIFDVDGVLLELTRAEEDAFFIPFQQRFSLENLSRDWNSYKIRNDENIVDEILERNAIPAREKAEVIRQYLEVLQSRLASRAIETRIVPGARELLLKLQREFHLGIATANFLAAARLRLEDAGLWNFVSAHAAGADGGGHKRDTVARAIETMDVKKSRIVYVGDNLNDVEAGLSNSVAFIGFSTDAARLAELKAAGATHTSNNHVETYGLIGHLLKR
jgi:HAD superfamily hydrolase (TIGR01549 family)